jgi:hypothetical protein
MIASEREAYMSNSGGVKPMPETSKTTLLPGEHPDIRVDARRLLSNADEWLNTPNTHLGGLTPNDLIGTSQEQKVREILRSAIYSSMA